MGQQGVEETVEYLRSRQENGCLRWDKNCVIAFSKLLGSGFINESIRSLWPLYQDHNRRFIVAHLLQVTEGWRRFLRKAPVHDLTTNGEFLRVIQALIVNLEHQGQLPQSPLFLIDGGRLKWTGKMSQFGE